MLRAEPAITVVDLVDFSSIIANPNTNSSLFVAVRAVTPGYPARGTVTLDSGRSVDEALSQGSAIVDSSAAARLNLSVGSVITLGESTFTVTDSIVFESMAPVDLFSNGRVLVRVDDLPETGLVGERSRLEYLTVIATPRGEETRVLEMLQASLAPREDAELAVDAASGAQRFLTNTLFFIRIISLFTLLLAGLAMTSAVRAILRRRQDTIGVAKALGMTDGEVLRHYLLFIAILGAVGTVLGIILGLIVQQALPALFADLLPREVPQIISLVAIGKGIIYGLLVTVLFSAIPLLQLKSIRPNVILRREAVPIRATKSLLSLIHI